MRILLGKLHVAVDLDDVVLDFWQGVLDSFNLEFGYDLAWNGPWDDQALKQHPALLAAGYGSWWDWLRDRDWLWGKVFKAVPGAVGGVKRLRHEGHYVECVTSKPEWAEYAVWQFQGRYRVPFSRITVVSTGQSKLDYTSADLIVDDRLETCREWAADGRRAVLFDRVHGTTSEPRITVAKDWHEVVDQVREAA
jgi:5'(3')-deoxyribonucleotidase